MDLNYGSYGSYGSYAQTANLVDNITYIDLSNSIVLKELSSNSKIIKGISILFLIAIFNYIFPYERYKYDSNYKLYVILFVAFLIYLIYINDLYLILILILIIIVFIVPPIVILYYYLKKQEAIIKFFYSYNNQVKQILDNNINLFELLFNILFISIIFILSIVLYWDNIYSDAKKISKCGRILKIIEDNTFKKKPYVYNIILLDNNSLDTKPSNNILKITYDFMKMKTIIENNKPKSIDENIKVLNYFNLKTMNLDIIENIDPSIIEDIKNDVQQKYKFLCVDENNKPVYDYSSNELSRFTKKYSINTDYSPTIIYDIIYAKINNNKVFV